MARPGYWRHSTGRGGKRDLAKRLEALLGDLRERVAGEMREIAEEVLRDAQERAPRDTGELAESGYLEERSDGLFEVGFRAEHAAVQHERLDYDHPQGGEPKYLERALDEAALKVEARLAKAAQEVLRE